jgi:hypothetical protein
LEAPGDGKGENEIYENVYTTRISQDKSSVNTSIFWLQGIQKVADFVNASA